VGLKSKPDVTNTNWTKTNRIETLSKLVFCLRTVPCMRARQRQAQWAKGIDKVQKEVFSDHGKATKSHSCKSEEHKME
jgi:hypothetical protein